MKEKILEAFEAQLSRVVDQLLYNQTINETSPLFPAHVHIEPTNVCNLRCIHCHHHEGSRKTGKFTRPLGMMEMALYRKVIDEIAPKGCSISLNCQGEPTLHKNLVEMIALAKSREMHVSLLTNGTTLCGNLADEILSSGVDRVVFSFDAVEKERYQAIRVGGDFDRTFGNINTFIDKNHRQGHRIFICMSIIVQQMTMDHLADYRKYFADKPVDTLFESPILNLSGNNNVGDRFDLIARNQVPSDTWPVCRVPWENIVVNWDGAVTVCPLDFDAKWNVGSVANQTLEEIWNGKGYRTFRRAHMMKEYESIEGNGALCSTCNCLWDPEYNLLDYPGFAKKKLLRLMEQYAVKTATLTAE